MDIYIGHPRATSDFLSFMTSPLHRRLEKPNFLHPDVCIFGDNAYVNTQYMGTPYKAVTDGEKDAFNYYQSQLRIASNAPLECYAIDLQY
jgi:hypothetical protein